MGLFGSILKAGINVVTAPIEVVKDVVTVGGLATDQKKSYTQQRLEELADDAEQVIEEIDDEL